jgi:hypothetical protein
LAKFDIALRFFDIPKMEEARSELDNMAKNISISKKTFLKQEAFLEACKGNESKALQIMRSELERYPEKKKAEIRERIADMAKRNVG